jgi:hypothetical protein
MYGTMNITYKKASFTVVGEWLGFEPATTWMPRCSSDIFLRERQQRMIKSVDTWMEVYVRRQNEWVSVELDCANASLVLIQIHNRYGQPFEGFRDVHLEQDKRHVSQFRGFRRGASNEYVLLGHDGASLGERILTLRDNVASSIFNSQESNKVSSYASTVLKRTLRCFETSRSVIFQKNWNVHTFVRLHDRLEGAGGGAVGWGWWSMGNHWGCSLT